MGHAFGVRASLFHMLMEGSWLLATFVDLFSIGVPFVLRFAPFYLGLLLPLTYTALVVSLDVLLRDYSRVHFVPEIVWVRTRIGADLGSCLLSRCWSYYVLPSPMGAICSIRLDWLRLVEGTVRPIGSSFPIVHLSEGDTLWIDSVVSLSSL